MMDATRLSWAAPAVAWTICSWGGKAPTRHHPTPTPSPPTLRIPLPKLFWPPAGQGAPLQGARASSGALWPRAPHRHARQVHCAAPLPRVRARGLRCPMPGRPLYAPGWRTPVRTARYGIQPICMCTYDHLSNLSPPGATWSSRWTRWATGTAPGSCCRCAAGDSGDAGDMDALHAGTCGFIHPIAR